MKKGKVQFFDPYKGFGIILGNDGIQYFVNINDLRSQVKKGDTVEFTFVAADGKPTALKVRLAET